MNQSIIYIYPSFSTFIQKDIDILSKKYKVITPKHNWTDKKFIPLRFLQQFYFLCKNISGCSAVFVMFGGYWSFLPSLFGKFFKKQVFIILGGTDCVSFPSLNYGSLRKPLLATFIKWSYQLCSKLIPVDNSLVYCNYNYYEYSQFQHQGYKYFFPKINTPYEVVYNGFDPVSFRRPINRKEQNSFIVVAYISNMVRVKLKGIDIVLKLAEVYDYCSFTVVGIQKNVSDQLGTIPENVVLLPFLPQDEFKYNLLSSEFVLQLSISEGFPNALCEAMLCGCIPIGSSVGAIPYIIGDTGFVLKSSNTEYIEGEFSYIVKLTEKEKTELAEKARSRIIDNFHISRRERCFDELLERSSKSESVIDPS